MYYAAVVTFASQIVETSTEPETSNADSVTVAEVEPAPGVLQISYSDNTGSGIAATVAQIGVHL